MDFRMPGVGQLITVLLVTGSGAMVSAITTVPPVELWNTSPLVSIITAAAPTGSDNATTTTVLSAETVTNSFGNVTENIKETAYNVTNFAVNVTQVPQNVTPVSENVGTVVGNVSTVEENVGTVTENVTTADENVTPVPENVTHLSEDVTTVNDNITTVAENVTTVSENVTTVSENITTVAENVTTVFQNVTTVTEDVTTVAGNVTTVSENATTVAENVTPVSENATTVSENVTTVSENVTTVAGNVTPVSENVTTVSEDVTTVSEDVSTISENVTTVSENVTTVTEDVTTGYEEDTRVSENGTNLVENVIAVSENVSTGSENVTTVSVNVTDWRLANPDNVTSKVSKNSVNKAKHLTLGAKWAACFEALNMSKPNSTTFTCDTFLLMHYSFKEFWTQQPAVKMCEHREAYGALMECVLEASKGCLPPENLVHVPDNSKARVGLNYICDVGLADEFDVNITCAQTHFRDVFECVHREVKMVIGRKSLPVPIWPRLMCRTYDIADLCCWERLQVCGRQTAGAYTRMMSLYLRPPSCNGSASRFKSTNILTLLLIVLLCSYLITVSSTTYFYR